MRKVKGVVIVHEGYEGDPVIDAVFGNFRTLPGGFSASPAIKPVECVTVAGGGLHGFGFAKPFRARRPPLLTRALYFLKRIAGLT